MHKLGAQLYGYRDTTRSEGQDAAADPVARFEDDYPGAIAGQPIGSGQPCDAGADDNDINHAAS